ncbi:hypothetical protein [Streptomyces sp. NPDC001537]
MNNDVPVTYRRQVRRVAGAVLGAVCLLALAACGRPCSVESATASRTEPADRRPPRRAAATTERDRAHQHSRY